MKRFLLAAMLVLLVPSDGFADSAVSVEVAWPFYTSDAEAGYYPYVKAKASVRPCYAWVSWEQCAIRPLHVSLREVQIFGVGIGLSKGPLFVEFGGFFPAAAARGTWKHGEECWEPLAETQAIELRPLDFDRTIGLNGSSDHFWPEYRYNINPGIGGAVGLRAELLSRDKWRLLTTCSYRLLKLHDKIIGFNPDLGIDDAPHWVTTHNRELQAVLLGIEIEYN